MVKDHILIVHFPSEQRVLQLVDEIRSDPEQGRCEIVIVSDAIDELPFKLPDVIFVRGSSHDIETYTRARASECRMAVVLSPNYGNRNSDAIVAAAVSVIDRVKSDIYIVAECLEEKHRPLFDSCSADAVVLGMTIAGSLLIQEVHDPGIAQLIEVMSSNRRGTTLFSVEVYDEGVAYLDMARALGQRRGRQPWDRDAHAVQRLRVEDRRPHHLLGDLAHRLARAASDGEDLKFTSLPARPAAAGPRPRTARAPRCRAR